MLIHIGYHKTATTWLQKRFFNRQHGYDLLADHGAIDMDIVRPHELSFDAETLSKKYNTLRSESPVDLYAVLSSELLCGNPIYGSKDSLIIARRLKSVFPDARILITIRQQISMMSSIYRQYIRRGGTLSCEKFFSPEHTPGYYHFEHDVYKYHLLAEYYIHLFGRENVCILPFEHFILDRQSFLGSINNFSGQTVPHTLKKNSGDNIGLGAQEWTIGILRQLNKFRGGPISPPPFATLSALANQLYKGVEKTGNLTKRGARSSIKEYLETRYVDEYRESNNRLQNILDYDLSTFGYMM